MKTHVYANGFFTCVQVLFSQSWRREFAFEEVTVWYKYDDIFSLYGIVKKTNTNKANPILASTCTSIIQIKYTCNLIELDTILVNVKN